MFVYYFLSACSLSFECSVLCYKLYPRCSQSNFFGNKFSFLKNMGNYFRKAFLLLEAKRLAPQPYPRCSQSNSYIACIHFKICKTILSACSLSFECSVLCYKLYPRCSQSNFFGNKFSFLKNMGNYFRKAFLLLEAKRLAPQPYPRCSQNNSSI